MNLNMHLVKVISVVDHISFNKTRQLTLIENLNKLLDIEDVASTTNTITINVPVLSWVNSIWVHDWFTEHININDNNISVILLKDFKYYCKDRIKIEKDELMLTNLNWTVHKLNVILNDIQTKDKQRPFDSRIIYTEGYSL